MNTIKTIFKQIKQNKLFSISILILILIEFSVRNFIVDDTFFLFRYAQHLAQGFGLVWNYPPFDPVEGYSNFLWIVILSTSFRLGIEPILFAKLLGATFSIINVFLTYYLALKVFNNKWIANLSAFIVVIMPAFALWGVSGMETQFFTFLFLIGIILFVSEYGKDKIPYSSVVFALFAMTRPEGAIIFCLFLLLSFALNYKSPKKVIFTILLFGIIYVPYFIWRWDYYGYFLPNTAYTRSGFSIDSIKHTLTLLYAIILYIPGVLALSLLKEKTKNIGFIIILYMSIVWIIFSIFINQGMMYPLRFFLPIIPLMSIISAKGIHIFTQSKFFNENRHIKIAVIFLFVLLLINPIGINQNKPHQIVYLSGLGSSPTLHFLDDYFNYAVKYNNFDKELYLGNHMTLYTYAPLGKWLKNNTNEDTIITLGEAGAIPFYAERNVVDMLYINDEYLTHNGPSAEYVFSFDPEFAIFVGDKTAIALPYKEYFTSPYFLDNYELVRHIEGVKGGWYVWVFQKMKK